MGLDSDTESQVDTGKTQLDRQSWTDVASQKGREIVIDSGSREAR